jgi:hypothetical protein
LIRGDSHDNQFVNNDFFDAALHFQLFREGATLTRPTRNVVDGGTIVKARPCVRFSGAFGNLLRGIRLSQCASAVASTGDGISVENTVIGIALKPGDLSLDARSRLYVGWQLEVAVVDARGAAVGGARVQGFDAQNNLVFDAVTAANGQIPAQEVIQDSWLGTTATGHTPHTLQVTTEQMTARRKVTIDANQAVTLSIPAAGR